MKKLIKLTCFSLFIMLSAASCSSDDDSSSNDNSSNTIEYLDETIDVTSAIIEDFGTTTIDSYYNYDFILTGDLDGISYEFYVELFSEGINEFRTGTFEYTSTEFADSDEFYYENATFEFGDTYLDVVGGDITVTGSGDDYSITGTLTLDNDETVTISYDGIFSVIDIQ